MPLCAMERIFDVNLRPMLTVCAVLFYAVMVSYIAPIKVSPPAAALVCTYALAVFGLGIVWLAMPMDAAERRAKNTFLFSLSSALLMLAFGQSLFAHWRVDDWAPEVLLLGASIACQLIASAIDYIDQEDRLKERVSWSRIISHSLFPMTMTTGAALILSDWPIGAAVFMFAMAGVQYVLAARKPVSGALTKPV